MAGQLGKTASGKPKPGEPNTGVKGRPMNKTTIGKIFAIIFAALMAITAPLKAEPGQSWPELKNILYKDAVILPAKSAITLTAPYRAEDDRFVPIDIRVQLPGGAKVKKLTFIIDENPMPVSAEFEISKPESRFFVSTKMRLNGPSPIRAIVEATDGKIYMAEKYVKTSGLGACASPPVGDPDELLNNLGRMQFSQIKADKTTRATSLYRRAHISIKHPNLTGLQMNQITLRYILARFIKKVKVRQGNQDLFTMTGSISFSENPELAFDYQLADGEKMEVTVEDTDKAVFKQTFALGLGS